MALEAARRLNVKALVFGPAFLKKAWELESQEVGVSIFYCPYSQIHKLRPTEMTAAMYIADECHLLKNPRAARTHKFYEILKTRKPKYFIGLTGTPIKNRVPDFWTLLGFCSVNPLDTNGVKLTGNLSKYYSFCRHFCRTETMDLRGRKIEKFTSIKPERIDEFKSLLREKFIRFKVAEVLDDLPDLTRKIVSIELAPQPGLLEEYTAYMEGRKRDIGAKVASAGLKAPHTASYCLGLMDEGSGPLLIFSDHVGSAQLIHRKLGGLLVTGATAMDKRIIAVSEFQAGRVKALTATLGALSVGVTLTAARHVVFNDLSWVPSDNLQAEKRIHRIGQKNACIAHYIDATETDAHIRKTLFEKLKTIGQVLS